MPGGGQVVPMAELELSGLVAQPHKPQLYPPSFCLLQVSHEDTQ